MDGLILSGERRLTQSPLFQRATQVASGFDSLAIAENDAVALALLDDFACFEPAMGAGLLGAYAVPVNWHFKVDEAGYIIRDCGAKVVVVHADLLPQIRDGIPPATSVLIVSTPPEIRDAYGIAADVCAVLSARVTWDAWFASQPQWTQPPRATRTNMIYTSGTTG